MFLFGTMTMFSQTIKVRGVTLSYDKVKKVMTLYTPHKSMRTDDVDMDVNVEISKEFALKMIINGVTFSTTEPYFRHCGHVKKDGLWMFITFKHGGCKEIKMNEMYQFTNVQLGEEYILTVSDLCDDKYSSNEKSGSIIIY